MTIYEYLLVTDPGILLHLQLIGLLGGAPVAVKAVANQESWELREIKRLMGHDSYQRKGGAVRQKGWGG